MPSTIKRQLTKRVIRERDPLITDASLDLNMPSREILELARKRGTGISSNLDTQTQSASARSAKSKMWGDYGCRDTAKLAATNDGYSADDFAQMARLNMLESRTHLTHPNPVGHLCQHTKWLVGDADKREKSRKQLMRKLLADATATPATGESNPFLKLTLSRFCLTLGSVDQLIFRMLYNGHTHQYCADKLGISRVAVTKRVSKFPRLIETWLADQFVDSTYAS